MQRYETETCPTHSFGLNSTSPCTKIQKITPIALFFLTAFSSRTKCAKVTAGSLLKVPFHEGSNSTMNTFRTRDFAHSKTNVNLLPKLGLRGQSAASFCRRGERKKLFHLISVFLRSTFLVIHHNGVALFASIHISMATIFPGQLLSRFQVKENAFLIVIKNWNFMFLIPEIFSGD